jgi:DNA-binding beta-propeller fold protein YncE
MRYPLGILLSVIAMVFSCDDEKESLPSPASALIATPVNQTGYSGMVSSLPAAVQLYDKDGFPVSGIEVTFTLVQGAATIHNEQAVSDENGVAFTYVTFKDPGEVKIEASIAALNESFTFVYKVSISRASVINILSGNNQEGLPGTLADEPLNVLVTDDFGNVAADVPVKFLIKEGNGTLSEEIAETNTEGIATTSLTLSSITAINTIAAAIPGDTSIFTLFSLYASEITSVNETDQGISVMWEQSQFPAFKEYRLERRSETYNGFQQITTISNIETTGYVDVDVVAGKEYEYRIVAVSQKGTQLTSSTKLIDFGEFVSLEARASDFEFDEARNKLYVSISALNAIDVYDLTTHEFLERIIVGSKPAGISLSHDGSILYVALFGSGDVAFLDLESKQVTKVDVEDEVGDVTVSDVIEGAPGRVFVTGNPQQYGIAYVAVIKTDEGNKAERFLNAVVRFDPILAAKYGSAVYVLDQYGFYTLDPYGNYMDNEYTSALSFSAHTMVLNPSGTELYIGTEVWNTDPFSSRHTYDDGMMPALSADGASVHYLSSFRITSYNSATFAKTGEIPFSADVYRKFGVTPDGSTFIIFCYDYSRGERMYFVKKN